MKAVNNTADRGVYSMVIGQYRFITIHTLPHSSIHNLVLFVWGPKGLDFTRLLTARRYLFSQTRFFIPWNISE